ncbi:MAG: metallophosphoesterase [Armatimonadota bacterium]
MLIKKFFVLLLAFIASAPSLKAQEFVLPVFPDTQRAVNANPKMLDSQIEWLIKNRKKYKMPMALHVGDVVDYDSNKHWETASQAFRKMDEADFPYAFAVGNHDTSAVGENTGSAAPGNTNLNLRKTEKLNRYFPVSRFINQHGRYEENKSDNAWYTFRAENRNWLVVTLEFCARRAPVDWADKLVAQYPNYHVIILTHYHLNPDGEIATRNAGYGDLSPKQIFDDFITKHKNIVMVLSGHVCYSASRVDKGKQGNNIYQILQDYQNEDDGGGYLRLLTINVEKRTIGARMYSPFYNKYKEDKSTFVIENVDFLAPQTP